MKFFLIAIIVSILTPMTVAGELTPIATRSFICLYRVDRDLKIRNYYLIHGERNKVKKNIEGIDDRFFADLGIDFILVANGSIQDKEDINPVFKDMKSESKERIIFIKDGKGLFKKVKYDFGNIIKKFDRNNHKL